MGLVYGQTTSKYKMRWIVGLLAILVALTGQADSQHIVDNIVSQVSSFFQTYDEAPYNVTRITAQYQERSYPAQKWVCTEQTAPITEDVSETQFWNCSDILLETMRGLRQ